MNYTASTQTNVKLQNQQIILQLLRNKGAMSRADVAKKMKSSKPTISKNVEELLKSHKIIEIGKDNNMVGKKGMLLDINEDYGYVLALDLSKNKFSAVIANIKEQWCHFKEMPFDDTMEEKEVFHFLENFLVTAPITLNKILYVTIAYAGIVNEHDELYVTTLKYKEKVLHQILPYLQKKVKKPLLIKNNVNLAVLAEKKYGAFVEAKNLYLLSADVGVGGGIILQNELYEGDRKAAGEIGFLLPVQSTTKYETIEERVGLHYIEKRYSKVKGKKLIYKDLVEHLAKEEKEALTIYEEIVEDLAVTIGNISSILDIQTIVVTGRLFEIKPTIIEDITARMATIYPLKTVIHKTKVENMSLKGAVAIGVEKIIASFT